MVHIARADTFPTTVLESQACGTPVVASSVGGIPEQIENGEDGFLVPSSDAGALAARIEQILTEPGLSARLGGRSIDSARRRFDVERQADDYLKWYCEIIEDRVV